MNRRWIASESERSNTGHAVPITSYCTVSMLEDVRFPNSVELRGLGWVGFQPGKPNNAPTLESRGFQKGRKRLGSSSGLACPCCFWLSNPCSIPESESPLGTQGYLATLPPTTLMLSPFKCSGPLCFGASIQVPLMGRLLEQFYTFSVASHTQFLCARCTNLDGHLSSFPSSKQPREQTW